MPFTAYIPKAVAQGNKLARCFGKNTDELDHAQKVALCADCPLRFTGETSCNVDFMVISDTAPLKEEIGNIIEWTMANSPDWLALEPAFAEANAALGGNPPEPKEVLLNYLKQCKAGGRDPDYWKAYNRFVEWYGARNVPHGAAGSPEEAIVNDIIAPRSRSGDDLRKFYAAIAVIEMAAERLGWPTTKVVCDALIDACRRAILANTPLEVQ